ncbi:hypothetical protein P691DRAFT_725659 [Macrolepiota fuliginosa MF-IS2]|uniref:NACHT domain-containing protein n=1 Tax=Macrolepiota fuliginosa MF-IS2 TaxID=1400762 RepID=A0A9P6C686_9AGAR|nr:hypothetical protein P691DRAFT_725659 [Macrolepiota fuliginosa MF-IS2]
MVFEAVFTNRTVIQLLARHVIEGAEFDSSERYPPPHCHPGTRLDISGNLQSWIRNPSRDKRIVWLHGPAGVGKSAIIQTLAESESDSLTSILGATLFFSRSNGRDNPQRVFITIAYQLTVKYPKYRNYVVNLLATNPRLVGKSLVEQFKWFITKPFVDKLFDSQTVLIILDGLEECFNEVAQRDIILLIGRFTLQHPAVPLIWIVSSRPEPHLQAAFSSPGVKSSYLEVEVPHNSSQACLDVERYMRDEFIRIRETYPYSFPLSLQYWPSENDFLLLATRASGLFIFASIVIRFVDNVTYGNPIGQLKKITTILEPTLLVEGRADAFAFLDTLYTEVLSNVPHDVLPVTREIFTFLHPRTPLCPLDLQSNLLKLRQEEVYGALQRLHPVLNVPPPGAASKKFLCVFHASFVDYLFSSSRSGSFCMDPAEARRKVFWLAHRTLTESLNPAEPTIEISRIQLTWLVEDERDYQQRIFDLSLETILDTKPEILNKSIWDGFASLAPVFKALDFRGLYWSTKLTTSLLTLCFTQFRPYLEEWKLLERVPIGSLDWNRIDMNKPARVCWYKSNEYEVDLFKEIEKWDWDYRATMHVSEYNFAKDGEYTHHAKALPLNDAPDWRDRFNQHLSTVAKTTPTIFFELIGQGDGSLVFIQIEVADQPHEMWDYLFHYNQL